MDTHMHEFTYSTPSTEHIQSCDGDRNGYPLEAYNASSYQQSLAPPDAFVGSSSGTSSPRSQGTEWDFGPTDIDCQIDALVWPTQIHPEFAYCTESAVVSTNLASYDYTSHHRPCTPAFGSSPPITDFWHGIQEEYSLSIPLELSSTCLDSQRSIAVEMATRHWQLGGPDGESVGIALAHSLPLSQAPAPLFPPHGHAPRSSATSPAASFYSERGRDSDDGEYLPALDSTRRSAGRPQLRSCSTIKRVSSSQSRKSDSFPSPSTGQKHACHFPSCTLAFARARDLKRHFRLHSGELPYKCDGCGRGFIRSDARARHWRTQTDCAPSL